MKINKNYLLVAGLLIGAPIVLSQLIRLPFGNLTIGDEDAWVGFFGGYIGSISGAIVAFIVAKYQINTQFKKQIANEEMISFMSQKPALLKMKYELKSMKEALDEIVSFPPIEDEENNRWLVLSFEMYELNELNWSTIDRIESTDLSVDLITISNTYRAIFKNFKNDLVSLDALKETILNELVESSFIDYDRLHRTSILEEQIKRIAREREEIVNNGTVKRLAQDIENVTEIIDIIISSIDEEKEKRQAIRDSLP